MSAPPEKPSIITARNIYLVAMSAAGLALAILGLGLSGVIGAPFVGVQRAGIGKIEIPWLSDIPFLGPLLFRQDPFVYASVALVIGVWWFLTKSRAGLVLRAVGENHAAAHALGYPVRRIRLLAIMFGGGCAGLAGSYMSLVYTPFWTSGMTGGVCSLGAFVPYRSEKTTD